MIFGFSYEEAVPILKPLLYFVVVMVIYTTFVFKLYRFMARKNIFELNLYQYNKAKHGGVKKFFEVIFYVLEYIIIFPILAAAWVIVVAVLLFFMSEGDPFSVILMGAVAVVASVRITAYFSEELSREVAKLLPLALLALVLTKISSFTISGYTELADQVPALWKTGVYYLIFIIAVEFVFRILSSMNIIYPEPKA
ncbi:hypothetical protein KY308_02775 [Candidatus Woesearchaeota archaeon]|nr:hypothetical protein [Candidatus Woesearchaeota archaeon]